MEVELIREFVTLGKTLNFTKAAQVLNVDQSTLSRHLQSLEKQVGVPLVSRTSRSVALTPAGEAFLGDAMNILVDLDDAMQRAWEAHEKSKETIRLGGVLLGGGIEHLVDFAMICVAKEKLPVSVEIYQPHLSQDPTVLTANEAPDSLRRGDVDMAVYFPCDREDWTGLEHEPLFRDPFYLVASEDHPLASRESVCLDDLRHYVLRTSIFYKRNNEHVSELCEKRGFTPKTRAKVIRSGSQWCVADGPEDMFVYNKSALSTVPPSELSGLVVIPITDPDAYFEAHAVWHEGDENAGIAVFLNAMKRACEMIDFGSGR